jgi:hypothetical protein
MLLFRVSKATPLAPPPPTSILVLNYFSAGNVNLVGAVMTSGLNARFPYRCNLIKQMHICYGPLCFYLLLIFVLFPLGIFSWFLLMNAISNYYKLSFPS